jgi:SAM-dependent methyltransferase
MTQDSQTPSLKKLIGKPVKSSLSFGIKALTRIQNKLFADQARMLNWQLYSDAWSISQEELEKFEAALRRYSKERRYEPDYEAEFLAQRYRIYLSLKWLEQALAEHGGDQSPGSLQGLEMGGITVVTDLLAQAFPQVRWQNTSGDIRYAWDNPDASTDIIASMEVLEHLSDLPDGINNGFYSTGMRAALGESYRVLKPGGLLFITTPNAASTFNLNKALAGVPAWFYHPHVREYTLGELKTILEDIGFKVQRAQTVQCLTVDYKLDYTFLFQSLLNSLVDANVNDRGDDLFIVAVK